MKTLPRNILEKLIAGSAEPLLVARIDSPDWPVVLGNPPFEAIAGGAPLLQQPMADVVERLLGRELALEISETVRSGQETTIPVEHRGREYLLSLQPLSLDDDASSRYYAIYWRGAGTLDTSAGSAEARNALLKAKRRIRDLSRDDPVTGLMSMTAFRDVLDHDWAVASREKSALALVAFSPDDFDEYLHVFGRHATDSCLRRIAQAIRRSLRRASDVAARVSGDEGEYLVVLSHAASVDGVTEFAARIAASVRELGIHHPRSKVSKFVTVSYEVAMMKAGEDKADAGDFLARVLAKLSA